MGRIRFQFLMGLVASAAFLFSGMPANAQHFQVTVTNLTGGQTFTPIMVATHMAGVTLFTLGQPASVDLQHMAEAGDVSELEATLSANPKVLAVMDTGATLAPGQSVTLTIAGGGPFSHISIASMLIPTNAGFFALNNENVSIIRAFLEGGPANKTLTFFSPAYDAGSKLDDELCANIPGPPTVCTGTGYITPPTGRGFVTVHSGIHGIGDLPAATYDWRNPVAKITVTRMP